MDNSFELLLAEYIDGDATPETVARLCDLLKSSPELQSRFREELRLHTLLREIGSEAVISQPATLRSGPTNLRRSRLYVVSGLMALAASLVLVAGVWWMAQGRGTAGVELSVAEVRGKCSVFSVQYSEVQSPESGVTGARSHPVAKEGNTQHSTLRQAQGMNASNTQRPSGEQGQCELRVGDVVRPGNGVAVGAEGFVKMAYADGTWVELARNTRLRVTRGEGENRDAKRLALDAGKMLCEAAKQRKAFAIRTPHATARVVGTRFGLEVVDDKTRLAVTEGQVAVERSGQTLLIGSNQTAEASGNGLKMMPLRIALVGTVIKKLMARLESPGRDGIAFDGHVLWMNTFASNVLVKVDPVSGALVGRLEVNSGATPLHMMNGLAWDGTHLWVSAVEDATLMSKNRICAVDPVTGRVMKTLDLPSGFGASGVAAGDGHLWCMALARDRADVARVCKLDSSSGAVAASWPVPPEAGGKCGLEYMDGAVWVVNWKKVWKLAAEDGAVLGVFDTPEPLYDLAQSGSAGQMWMLGRMSPRLLLVEIREGQ